MDQNQVVSVWILISGNYTTELHELNMYVYMMKWV